MSRGPIALIACLALATVSVILVATGVDLLIAVASIVV
jgi:hypothetical protein